MHSWKRMVELLELVNRPKTMGFQADMAHSLLYTLGYNAPEDRLLPPDFDWSQQGVLMEALRTVTDALRPWTIDFHVAQNDGTVKAAPARTTRPGGTVSSAIPTAKMDIIAVAGLWMRGKDGKPTRAYEHICWDGCMFPNSVMMAPEDLERHTWERSSTCAMPMGGIDGAKGISTLVWLGTGSWGAPIPMRFCRRRAFSICPISLCSKPSALAMPSA